MGVRGSDEDAPKLARQGEVVLKMAFAGQQPFVLEPADRLTYTKLHRVGPSACGRMGMTGTAAARGGGRWPVQRLRAWRPCAMDNSLFLTVFVTPGLCRAAALDE